MISRGKPFIALAMLVIGWSTVRIASVLQPAASKPVAPARMITTLDQAGIPERAIAVAQLSSATRASEPVALPQRKTGFATPKLGQSPPRTRQEAALPVSITAATLPSIIWTEASATPPALIARAPEPASAPINSSKAPTPSRLSLYAYSFWRWPSGAPSLAVAGQYGGSQSGLIANYRIWDAARLDLQFRAAIAPQTGGEREVALGLRWQPVKALPVRIVTERRVSIDAPDRFAIAVTAGTPTVHLPAGVNLDSYGQAGWVSGSGGSWFFDASAQAMKPVAQLKPVSIAIGVGSWTGGQRGAQRLDGGPRIDISLPTTKLPLRLSADWRFRLAGDAQPASGPAITLSTAF